MGGDALRSLELLESNSVDSIVTDPPYGLSKEPDAAEVLRHLLAGEDYVHGGGGFMGNGWDSFVPGPSVWRECLRVLKPGGFLLAFGGTRTVDLLTIAVRLGGFEVRDLLQWLYGTGFPKSMDVAKAIDKQASGKVGAWRGGGAVDDPKPAWELAVGDVDPWNGKVITGIKPGHEGHVGRDNMKGLREGALSGDGGFTASWMFDDYAVASSHFTHQLSPEAAEWGGWGTALKPANEPIVMARKPLSESTVAANVQRWGTGALNIDAGRIPVEGQEVAGRWPSNVMLSHHPSCVEVGVAVLPGDRRKGQALGSRPGGFAQPGGGAGTPRPNAAVYGDEVVERWDCHPGCPIAALDRQAGARSSGKPGVRGAGGAVNTSAAYGAESRKEGDPMTGYGDSGSASRFFYCPKPSKKERGEGNTHPTVKPVALMEYLVGLTTRPGGTVLDPFCGSGTTLVAAANLGMSGIGLDENDEYLNIARRRLDAATRGADS